MREGEAMSTGFPYFLSAVRDEVQEVRRNWGWFLVLGILLVVLGMVAISYPVMATLATVEVFGFFLLIGGGVQIASALWARRWDGFFLHLLTGFLYVFVGAVILERPALGAAGYTLMLAVFFVAGGLIRTVFALRQRFSG